jgi:transposase
MMTNLLYLPNWTVLDVVIDENGSYQITAKYDVGLDHCLSCGATEPPLYLYGTSKAKFTDAPVHGRPTFIHVKRQRYRCRQDACKASFVQPLPDMDDDKRMTKRCREYIEKQCLLKPNTHVAEDLDIDEKIIRQIGKAQATRLSDQHDRQLRAPRILGIDELFLADEMRAIFVDIETSWPIEILTNRWQGPVTNFLMNLEGREKVEVVTTDMWRPYKSAVQYAMPQAVLIVDKWHVMRMANDVMETARRRYQAVLTAKDRKTLKRRRYLFLSRPYQLSAMELMDLDGWLKNTPELRGAYECKEQFMAIWESRSAAQAAAALQAWREAIPTHLKMLFRPVVTATRNWEPEILNYFDNGRYTNAPTEARNRVVKMINRNGAGYSFEMIRARALFGKRPARLKKEKAARAAALAKLITCDECHGLFEASAMEWIDRERTKRVCRMCNRFNTARWFQNGSASTPKSE